MLPCSRDMIDADLRILTGTIAACPRRLPASAIPSAWPALRLLLRQQLGMDGGEAQVAGQGMGGGGTVAGEQIDARRCPSLRSPAERRPLRAEDDRGRRWLPEARRPGPPAAAFGPERRSWSIRVCTSSGSTTPFSSSSRREPTSRLPGRASLASMPAPGWAWKSISGSRTRLRAWASARMSRAIGCSLPCSAVAAQRSSSSAADVRRAGAPRPARACPR